MSAKDEHRISRLEYRRDVAMIVICTSLGSVITVYFTCITTKTHELSAVLIFEVDGGIMYAWFEKRRQEKKHLVSAWVYTTYLLFFKVLETLRILF